MSSPHASQLRKLIDRDEILVAPGVYDALSGAIAEQVGFDALYLGGWATGASTATTEPMANRTEMHEKAKEILWGANLPLIIDGNAGFGNPTHTYRAIKEFAQAGIAGVHIEDQVYPKRLHYHADRKHVIDPTKMIKKIKFAEQGRQDANEDIVVIGRTDFLGSVQSEEYDIPIEEAVNRVNRYFDAGADVGMLFPESESQMKYAVDEAAGPMLFVSGDHKPVTPSVDELDELGFDVTVYSSAAIVAAAGTVQSLYVNIFEHGTTGWKPEEVKRIREDIVLPAIDLPTYWDLESEAGNK